jgi:hypothetical protein
MSTHNPKNGSASTCALSTAPQSKAAVAPGTREPLDHVSVQFPRFPDVPSLALIARQIGSEQKPDEFTAEMVVHRDALRLIEEGDMVRVLATLRHVPIGDALSVTVTPSDVWRVGNTETCLNAVEALSKKINRGFVLLRTLARLRAQEVSDLCDDPDFNPSKID